MIPSTDHNHNKNFETAEEEILNYNYTLSNSSKEQENNLIRTGKIQALIQIFTYPQINH